jgi:hypothetical protein
LRWYAVSLAEAVGPASPERAESPEPPASAALAMLDLLRGHLNPGDHRWRSG